MSETTNTNQQPASEVLTLNRRAFLCGSTLVMAGLVAEGAQTQPASSPHCDGERPVLKIGLLTDLHYADKDTKGDRHYRDSLAKCREAVDAFNRQRVDLAVELGDFIDSAPTPAEEIGYLERINREYARFQGHRYYALGNHCVWSLTKKQFVDTCGLTRTFQSFDHKGFHFVILDACFTSKGTPYGEKNFKWTDAFIPPFERDWLEEDLKHTDKPTVVFIHQRLDTDDHYAPHNSSDIRRVLEKSGQVLAVFQGHHHVGGYNLIHGIHYCTLSAMVTGAAPDSSSYAIVDVYKDGRLEVRGFRRQPNYTLDKQPVTQPANG